jgi:lipoprotein NlpI
MRLAVFGTAIFACVFLLMSHAKAQLSPQWQSCTGNSDVDWAEQIKSCTVLIESSYETTEHRVLAYMRRGIAYDNQGEFDQAIADYKEALGLNPQKAQAYYNRGNTYWHKGDYVHAIADFNDAIKLDPKSAPAYRSRGLAALYSSNADKALADLTQASKLDPKDPYDALWVDILEQRTKAPSRLFEASSQINMTTWPAPVIRMFLGQITPAALLAAADNADAKNRAGQVCEANFYSGEWALRTGAKEEADRLFRLAASVCPKDFLEWGAANAELKTAVAAH